MFISLRAGSHLAADAEGGAGPAISQQTEDQSRDKIVNLTWIKITARLNSQLISEPDKFKIKYKHHPSFRYRGWQGFGFEGIFLFVHDRPCPKYRFLIDILELSLGSKSLNVFPLYSIFLVFTTISWPLNNNLFTIIYKIIIWLNDQFLFFHSPISPPGWRMVLLTWVWEKKVGWEKCEN